MIAANDQSDQSTKWKFGCGDVTGFQCFGAYNDISESQIFLERQRVRAFSRARCRSVFFIIVLVRATKHLTSVQARCLIAERRGALVHRAPQKTDVRQQCRVKLVRAATHAAGEFVHRYIFIRRRRLYRLVFSILVPSLLSKPISGPLTAANAPWLFATF